MTRALTAFAVLLGLVLVPAARAQDDVVDRAIAALRTDPVYVDPSAERKISDADADRLQSAIRDSGAGPMFVAILPGGAVGGTGGAVGVLNRLREAVGREGTYVVVAGDRFRALSDDPEVEPGVAPAQATKAFEEHGGDGVTATLVDFAERIGEVRAGRNPDGSGTGVLAPIVLGLLALGGGALVLTRRRRRRELRAQMAELKENVRDELVALGDDIRALDIDVELDETDPAVKADYAQAVESYERADTLWERASSPDDFGPVASALEEGRFAMASAKARAEGRPAPERRPPCFFDPRHGPSTRDVEWAPPGGAPRSVPACEADALRVEEGEEPASRSVTVDGRERPYWDAGPAYAPFAGGYFGGGLLPGFLLGTALSGGFDGGSGEGGGGGSGDFGGHDPGGGGGDLGGGGGDFGGGGGGGGFGGFGGGGDFGGGGGDFGGGGGE